MNRKKISIIGAGRVGSTTALYCFLKELGDIVLWNRTANKAKGIALDMMESGPILNTDTQVIGTNDYRKTKNSDVIVITAGAQRTADMSRENLLKTNAAIVKDITKNVAKYSPNAVLIVVSNPLDAMVYVAKKVSGFKKNKVIGMAGILDSSRFKSFIAQELNVSVEDVNALVLGSHGDNMIPLVRHASVKGVPLTELMDKSVIKKLITRTRNAGKEIIQLEHSSAYYSTGAAITEMVEAIVKDKPRVLSCAAYLNGEYGVKGVYMGVPVILRAGGIEDILKVHLSKEEERAFKRSAKHVKELVAQL